MQSTRKGGNGSRGQLCCRGFSMLEVLMVLALMLIATMVVAPSIGKMVQAMRLRSSTGEVKNQLLAARFRAVAHPGVHCGVYFDIANGRSVLFLDKGATSPYTFNASDDELHGSYIKLPDGLTFSLPSSNPISNSAVIFRGDGTARQGGSIEIKDSDNNVRGISVLASTGKVKVFFP